MMVRLWQQIVNKQTKKFEVGAEKNEDLETE
jgi:hypothetical protein